MLFLINFCSYFRGNLINSFEKAFFLYPNFIEAFSIFGEIGGIDNTQYMGYWRK